MKIAMLVHNPVVGDARVRKEAHSLASAGFVVDLFGYGDPFSAPSKLENCRLTIAKKSPAVSFYSTSTKFLKNIIGQLRKLGKRNLKTQFPAVNLVGTRFMFLAFITLVGVHLFQSSLISEQLLLFLGVGIIFNSFLELRRKTIPLAEFIISLVFYHNFCDFIAKKAAYFGLSFGLAF